MRATALAALVLAGCNPAPPETGFSSGPPGPVETSGASSSTSSTGSTGSTDTHESTSSAQSSDPGSTSSSSEALPPDLGTLPDFGPAQPAGCKGKIDFVFAIARYGTMQQEQAALVASFDGFMATIQEDFSEFDAHILVANLDGWWTPAGCEQYRCPDYYPHCGPYAETYTCGTKHATSCDYEQGAGILFNAGPYATNHPCKLAGGRRYIVAKEEPDLAAQFKCIATVGTYGPDPPMMRGIDAALAPEINASGGCNEGFLRPDALLVIVMVMDVFDDASFGDPVKWAKKAIAAKGGDPDAVVMVAIIGPLPEGPQMPGCAYDDGIPKLNPLRTYAEQFPHHVFGSVCAETFVPALAEAATLVKDTCKSFIPQ
jgi:hypothetical protein